MNCPKCGFSQEERVDCKKCGVVFSKYLALYVPDGSTPSQAAEAAEAPPAVSAERQGSEIAEMRQMLGDLTRRFNELDFERIERNRMRSEIRGLAQKLDEALAGYAARTSELATRKEIQESVAALRSESIEPWSLRALQLEEKVAGACRDMAARCDAQVHQGLGPLERRQASLEARISEMLSGGSGQEESISPGRLALALKTVDEMRTSLQNVTLRYSEIGELKKNDLVLASRLDGLQQRFDATGNEAFKGVSARITELDGEVAALRAEVRQALARIEELQAAPIPAVHEVQPLREELATLNRLRSDDSSSMRSALMALDSKLNEGLLSLTGLPERVQNLATQIQRVEQRYQPLAKAVDRASGDGTLRRITDLGDTVSSLQKDSHLVRTRLQDLESKLETLAPARHETVHAAQTDMQVIRENLDEIRRFMQLLHQKV